MPTQVKKKSKANYPRSQRLKDLKFKSNEELQSERWREASDLFIKLWGRDPQNEKYMMKCSLGLSRLIKVVEEKDEGIMYQEEDQISLLLARKAYTAEMKIIYDRINFY